MISIEVVRWRWWWVRVRGCPYLRAPGQMMLLMMMVVMILVLVMVVMMVSVCGCCHGCRRRARWCVWHVRL